MVHLAGTEVEDPAPGDGGGAGGPELVVELTMWDWMMLVAVAIMAAVVGELVLGFSSL
jgi:hypothetical protein